MDIQPLHPFTRTKKEAQDLAAFLSNLNEKVFVKDFNLHEYLIKNAPDDLAAAIVKTAAINHISVENKDLLQQFFTNASGAIRTLPTAHFILPFDPDRKIIKKIHEWLYENTGKTVILDLTIEPDIIGGCVISFNGRANDYSLAGKIDQMD
jgi:F0F1-type ATP synthase delta subunit